jgi:hypothetical protein
VVSPSFMHGAWVTVIDEREHTLSNQIFEAGRVSSPWLPHRAVGELPLCALVATPIADTCGRALQIVSVERTLALIHVCLNPTTGADELRQCLRSTEYLVSRQGS